MEVQQILVLFPASEDQKRRLEEKAPDAVFRYTTPAKVTDRELEEAEIIFGNPPAGRLGLCRRLQWIQLNSAGYEQYLGQGILPEGVVLTNASGAYGLAISEYMLCALLMLWKKMPFYFSEQQQGRWSDGGTVSSVFGSRILVVGLGDIGGEFAKRAAAMGARVSGIRRRKAERPDYLEGLYQMDALDRLLPEMDVVALSVPASGDTIHLLDRERIARMKPGAVVINVGRGSAVDQEALCDALEAGKLGGAYLDVTEPEPLPAGHRLWRAPNLILTPHISGGFHLPETLERIVTISAENLEAFQADQPLRNVVNR